MLDTTHEYFVREHAAFMRALGTRTFWNLTQRQRDGALSGLFYAYTGCEDKDEERQRVREMAMQLAMDDYDRRSVMVTLFASAA